MEWDIEITKIVGTSKNGDKDFTASIGAIGTLKGKNTKLRVAKGTVKKTEDFKGKWKGSIAFVFADEGVSGSPFECTFDERTDGYYVFNIVA